MNLRKLTQGYNNAVVSLQGKQGYPISFPIEDFKIQNDKIIVHNPKSLCLDVKVDQKGFILFHTHNKFIKGIKSVSFQGSFTKVCEEYLEFTPHKHYSFKQGGLLNTLKFIINGKRRTKKYLQEKAKQKT
ncbi:MAG: hypothetical protein QW158_08280 [Nitrososphaerales archaeon]